MATVFLTYTLQHQLGPCFGLDERKDGIAAGCDWSISWQVRCTSTLGKGRLAWAWTLLRWQQAFAQDMVPLWLCGSGMLNTVHGILFWKSMAYSIIARDQESSARWVRHHVAADRACVCNCAQWQKVMLCRNCQLACMTTVGVCTMWRIWLVHCAKLWFSSTYTYVCCTGAWSQWQICLRKQRMGLVSQQARTECNLCELLWTKWLQ